jgi:hypothetical protein
MSQEKRVQNAQGEGRVGGEWIDLMEGMEGTMCVKEVAWMQRKDSRCGETAAAAVEPHRWS